MFDGIEIMRMAKNMAVHAAARQSLIAANVANADTPGYRAADLKAFAETYRSRDAAVALRSTRPAHLSDPANAMTMDPVRDRSAEPAPNGNSVSLETELVRAASAKRQHDVSLAVYRVSLDILRSSIGRGR